MTRRRHPPHSTGTNAAHSALTSHSGGATGRRTRVKGHTAGRGHSEPTAQPIEVNGHPEVRVGMDMSAHRRIRVVNRAPATSIGSQLLDGKSMFCMHNDIRIFTYCCTGRRVLQPLYQYLIILGPISMTNMSCGLLHPSDVTFQTDCTPGFY